MKLHSSLKKKLAVDFIACIHAQRSQIKNLSIQIDAVLLQANENQDTGQNPDTANDLAAAQNKSVSLQGLIAGDAHAQEQDADSEHKINRTATSSNAHNNN